MAEYDWFSVPRYECGFKGCKRNVWKAIDLCLEHRTYVNDLSLKVQLARIEAENHKEYKPRHAKD